MRNLKNGRHRRTRDDPDAGCSREHFFRGPLGHRDVASRTYRCKHGIRAVVGSAAVETGETNMGVPSRDIIAENPSSFATPRAAEFAAYMEMCAIRPCTATPARTRPVRRGLMRRCGRRPLVADRLRFVAVEEKAPPLRGRGRHRRFH